LLVDATTSVVGDWDRARLEQVVTNLLSNAIKYAAGAPVDVRVWKEGDGARLSVRDRGIGIAPSETSRIFEPFERAVSSRHYGGLGLGLYIVRRIVESHSGRVVVDSRPGEGATFTVELPLQ
jgi:signal transduction histidine kinase